MPKNKKEDNSEDMICENDECFEEWSLEAIDFNLDKPRTVVKVLKDMKAEGFKADWKVAEKISYIENKFAEYQAEDLAKKNKKINS